MVGPALRQVVEAVERLAATVLAEPRGTGPVESRELTTECLRVVYRLVFADLAVRRGGVLAVRGALASLELELVDPASLADAVLDELVLLLTVNDAGAGVVEPAAEPVNALGAVHERVLMCRPVVESRQLRLEAPRPTGSGRKAAGAYFTPPSLVGWLLDHALEPALDEVGDVEHLVVCDPSCGAGAFLVAATRRLRARGVAAGRALSRVVGVDLDAGALEIARVCLWLEAVEPGRPVAMPELDLRVADALLDVGWEGPGAPEGFHVVVGNPPFLNQLERLTSHRPGVAAQLNERSEGVLRPYTDVSAVFLQRAVGWVRPGGRVGLVQPQSLLAARDAAGVRAYVAGSCALEAIWASDVPVFAAHVLTCAPVLQRAAPQGPVRRFHGPAFDELEPRSAPELDDGWSFLVAAGLGIPETDLSAEHGILADVADCTADFRDQYYGLAPYVHEAAAAPTGHVAPLVTSGLIDPAESLWGRRSTRFLKRAWDAPVVDLDGLRGDGKLHRWSTRRLVPKVLVGTQGRVIEAVVDEDGRWLPSVPTITVVPAPDRLWHVLAVLLAPPVAAHAAARFAGAALSMRAIKLSAGQVGRLPLPVDQASWDRGAAAVRRAQQEPSSRRLHLAEAARHMCDAYCCEDDVLEWWLARLPG